LLFELTESALTFALFTNYFDLF